MANGLSLLSIVLPDYYPVLATRFHVKRRRFLLDFQGRFSRSCDLLRRSVRFRLSHGPEFGGNGQAGVDGFGGGGRHPP
jgi:hypothetical protein